MTVEDPFLFSFCTMIAAITLIQLFVLTPLFPKDRQQKRLMGFAIQVMASTTMFFGLMYFVKSVHVWLLILYLVVFFASIYIRSRKFFNVEK